jgi:glutaminase
MAVATVEDELHGVGDWSLPFSIQSISKVITLALVIAKDGGVLWTRVGREPSRSPFNYLVQLEYEHGIPRNPFINAGALVITDP